MLKSISMHQRDSKGIVKSNFITSCLAFRGSIPTYVPLSDMKDKLLIGVKIFAEMTHKYYDLCIIKGLNCLT